MDLTCDCDVKRTFVPRFVSSSKNRSFRHRSARTYCLNEIGSKNVVLCWEALSKPRLLHIISFTHHWFSHITFFYASLVFALLLFEFSSFPCSVLHVIFAFLLAAMTAFLGWAWRWTLLSGSASIATNFKHIQVLFAVKYFKRFSVRSWVHLL